MTDRISPFGHSPAATHEGVNYGRMLALTLALLAAWRIFALYLSQTELFFDEAQYWSWSEDLDFGYYSKPPLIAWLIRATTEACGQSEFCIRLGSPIVHTATAAVLYLIGKRLYDARIGFWSAIVFATLPGVSFSAGLISTDVPLLFFWAAALYCFILMLESRSWAAAIGLGAALGLGVLSKYAMLYFLLCAAIYALWDGRALRLLADARSYAALAIAGLIVTPNVVWNLNNKFATLSHTADNAKWGGSMFNFQPLLEFLGGQFGVFGVILVLALAWAALRAMRRGPDRVEKMLLSFALPVLILISVQAFLSRAHANWAAVSYVAAAILVTAALLRAEARRWFNLSLAMHVGVIGLIGAGNALAGHFTLGGFDPYERVLGWRAMAEAADRRVVEGGFKAIASERRSITAELLYYSKSGAPIFALLDGAAPRDHFELTRPITPETQGPILFISFKDREARLRALFESVEKLLPQRIAAGLGDGQIVYFFRVSGLKQKPPQPK